MGDSTHVEQVCPRPRRRRWFLRLVGAVAVGVVVATVTGALLPKPWPTVRTLLRIPLPTPILVRGGASLPDLPSHQRNQIALCKSRLVLGSALRDPTVRNLPVLAEQIEPIAWLEREVQVDFSIAPEIMRIAMTGMETSDLVVLVNAIREAYKREVVDSQISARKQRQEFLAELIQKYEDQLKAARETQKNAADLLSVRTGSGRELVVSFVKQQLGMTEKELLSTQAELRKAEVELKLLKVSLEKSDQLKVVDQEDAIDERVRQKVLPQQKERARLDRQTQIKYLETRIATLKETEKTLEPEIERLRRRVVELNKQGFKFDVFQEDISHLKEMSMRLKNEHEALKVELQAPSQVSMTEEAIVTQVKEPWRPLVPVLAGLGGFLFAFSCMAVRVRVSLR
jgi:succinoglycan biosynthesis transport protein ExoP